MHYVIFQTPLMIPADTFHSFLCSEPSVSFQRQHLPSDHEMKFRSSNPGRGKKFFCSPVHPNRDWGPPSALFCGYWGSFPGAKRKGREVDHSTPSCAKVVNEWSYTCTPPMCLLGVDGKKYYLFIPKRSVPILNKTWRFNYKAQLFSGILGK